MACSLQSVINTIRALYVAWTHAVSLSILPTTDIRAVASFSAHSNRAKRLTLCIALGASHTRWWNRWGLWNGRALPRCSAVKNLPSNMPETQETRVGSLGREDALKKEMATLTSVLALKIP